MASHLQHPGNRLLLQMHEIDDAQKLQAQYHEVEGRQMPSNVLISFPKRTALKEAGVGKEGLHGVTMVWRRAWQQQESMVRAEL
jgi:hypothetical protein